MNKRAIYLFILIAFTALTVYVIVNSQELVGLPELLERTNRTYLIIAASLMIGYLFINAWIIQIIGASISPAFNYKRSFFLSLVGQYYSLITPFATGGQPAQVYLMKSKYKVQYTKGTTITLKKFIVFQVVVTLYALLLFLLRFNLIFTRQRELLPFITFGLIINIIGCVIIILLSYNDKLIKKIVVILVGFFKKFRLFKRFDKEAFFKHIDEYVENIEEIKNNKKMMLKLVILTFFQLTCYFSITYFIYLALGYGQAHFIDILAIQTVLYVVVSFIPTPGGAGASESGFYIMFSSFFPRDVLLYAMLLWRVIVYYSDLIISGVVVLVDSLLHKTKIKFEDGKSSF